MLHPIGWDVAARALIQKPAVAGGYSASTSRAEQGELQQPTSGNEQPHKHQQPAAHALPDTFSADSHESRQDEGDQHAGCVAGWEDRTAGHTPN